MGVLVEVGVAVGVGVSVEVGIAVGAGVSVDVGVSGARASWLLQPVNNTSRVRQKNNRHIEENPAQRLHSMEN